MIPAISAAGQTGAPVNAEQNTQRSALASDFETFLRMLTVQARNQDPLEPLDSSEYASQLAQFSMVEQQVKANELLSGLTQVLGAVDLNQLAGWVGMDVKAAAPFRFENSPITLFAQANPAADRAELVIRNAQGTEVDRIKVPTDQSAFDWAGADGSGQPLPAGTYAASLESFSGDKLLSNAPAAVFSRVVEAKTDDGTVALTLDSGAEVLVSEVTQIRTGA